jgi:hypothetical protein
VALSVEEKAVENIADGWTIGSPSEEIADQRRIVAFAKRDGA